MTEDNWWFDEKIHEYPANNEKCTACEKRGKAYGYRIAITMLHGHDRIEQKRYYCSETCAMADGLKLKRFEMRQKQTIIA